MEGWIKLHRQLLTRGWFQNHKVFLFWTYCLLKATHKEFMAVVGCQKIPLLPGQFVFGLRVAAEETGLTVREIRTCIERLTKARNLTIKTTNKFSLISIVNWDFYQGEDSENDKQNDKQKGKKRQHTRTYNKNNTYREDSLEILSYLNQKTGRKYRDASHIEARLKDGGTVEECKAIIDKKSRDPYFIENPKFLNPTTLFRRSHWDQYLNEPSKAELPGNGSKKEGEDHGAARRREMETAEPVPCPPGLRPDFLKESEK